MRDFFPDPGSSLSGVNQVETPPPSIISPTEGLTVLSLLNSESPTQPQHHPFSVPPASYGHHVSPSPIQPSGFVHQQPPGAPVLWPLEHEQEAMLLQHYLDNVALFVRAMLKGIVQRLTTLSLT